MATSQLPRVEYDLIQLSGGLDQVTPTLSLPSGVARNATNFEVSVTGGYTRVAGYERFDGRPNPSDAVYAVTTVDITGSISVGDTITGATSGATGVVIAKRNGYLIDWSLVTTGLVNAAVNLEPYKTIFSELFSGRMLGDINNSGTLTSADASLAFQFTAGTLAPGAGRTYIEGFLTTQLLSDTAKYAAYLTPSTDVELIHTKSSGIFVTYEDVEVSGVSQGTVQLVGSTITITPEQSAQYLNLAADVYRADIQVVPGSGVVRGVVYVGSTVYAWRDNVGGTAMEIYKSTGSGWTNVPLGYELPFDAGTAAIAEGATVVGHSSGATGVVARVVVESGAYSSNDATGRLILSSVTGTWVIGDHIEVLGVKRAEATATATAITLQPAGRVETVIGNFGGSVNTTRIYGCDGVNRGFEFDGTVYVPLSTGMSPDVPKHCAFHKNHLFFSFGSSVQFSAIGDPYVWNPVFGAGEIALVDNVNAFLVLPGDQSTGAMAIYSQDNTFILYGTDSGSFSLVSYNVGTGARAYSAQNLSTSYAFDDRGVFALTTTLNYGNFDAAALTLNIRPFVQQRRNQVRASSVNREKSQYRVFFGDGTGLYLTIVNNKYMGAMPVEFPNPVECIAIGEVPTGAETSFFGSNNGYVYRLDRGTSFDGAPISATLELVFNPAKSPRLLKRWRRASLEVNGTAYADFAFNYVLGYGSAEYPSATAITYSPALSAAFWDTALWDSFFWDGRTLTPTEVEVQGTAENIALLVFSSSDYFEPFTINSAILHYSIRRGLR